MGNFFPALSVRYRYILLFLLGMLVCSLFSGCSGGHPAQLIPPAEDTYQPVTFLNDHVAGLKVARQERKPILLFFSIPDNTGSQRMMKTTFCDEEIKRLAQWLVCIHVDGSQESALCESLGISSFPTIVLSNVNGTEVRRLVGNQTPDQLAVQIHVLLQVVAQRSLTTGR